MSLNNQTNVSTKTITRASQAPQKLIWGESMIWEGVEESIAATVVEAKAPRRQRRPANPHLIHAFVSAFFGLGR